MIIGVENIFLSDMVFRKLEITLAKSSVACVRAVLTELVAVFLPVTVLDKLADARLAIFF